MAKRHLHLFEPISDFGALRAAALRAARGKRHKPRVAQFLAGLESELLQLQRELRAGRWRPGGYTEFVVNERKPRLISAAPFRDRVVHHALCAVIGPIFERGFIADSYASLKGRGTHRAIARYETLRDRSRFVLRADIFRYFPAIDHAILKRDLRRRIACAQTLRLCDAIIDGSNAQERVDLLFSEDDLLTPQSRRRGLPIGNLTSQLFGNIYLDPLDHYASEVLRAPYLRYLDDFALFGGSERQCEQWRGAIESFLEGRRLRLHPKKAWIAPTREACEYLGLVLGPGTMRRLPAENIRRMALRLRSLRDRWQAGGCDPGEVRSRVLGWTAHAEHADTRGLRHALFRGGWFDPLWSDGASVEAAERSVRPLSAGCATRCGRR